MNGQEGEKMSSEMRVDKRAFLKIFNEGLNDIQDSIKLDGYYIQSKNDHISRDCLVLDVDVIKDGHAIAYFQVYWKPDIKLLGQLWSIIVKRTNKAKSFFESLEA